MSLKEKELNEFGLFRPDVTEHFLARLSGGERTQLSERAPKSFRGCLNLENYSFLSPKVTNSIAPQSLPT